MHDPLITCRSPSAPVASRVPAWAWATVAMVAGVAGLLLTSEVSPKNALFVRQALPPVATRAPAGQPARPWTRSLTTPHAGAAAAAVPADQPPTSPPPAADVARGLAGGVGAGLAALAAFTAAYFGVRRGAVAGGAGAAVGMAAASGPAAEVRKPSKPRLPALDSIRFFLILYIVCGHFIQVCVTNPIILRLFTQINVVVGAFFVLSGYVAGYTGTLVGKQEADPRLSPPSQYVIGKVMGYYPLHLLVLLLFSPMFLYADWYYNGPVKALLHGGLSLTLTQSWFPLHAEVWNAPTWFLSAMSFAMVAMPSAIGAIAKLSKKGLAQAGALLSVILLLPRLAYSYDLGVWSVMEGMLNARTHPNIAYWNSLRFHPVYALLEMLLGVVACRGVMLDTEADKKTQEDQTGLWGSLKTSPLWPLLGMAAVIALRAWGVLGLNDALTRSLLFLPLFTQFLVTAHRQTLRDTPEQPSLTRALAWGPLTYLGAISFPIFVLHGPLGQLLYKKVIASLFFWQPYNSQVWFFVLYLALTVAGGALLQWAVLSRKWFANATKSATTSLSSLF